MWCLAVATVTAVLIATAAGPSPAAGQVPWGCHTRWPVTAFHAGDQAMHVAHVAHLPVACGSPNGYAASETTLALTGGGAILFSPANTENTLARSADGGHHWTLVGPTDLQHTNLWNTVDPQVVVDRRTGRLFWVHATYAEDFRWPLPDQSPAAWLVPLAIADAHGFQVFSSPDGGRT